MAGDLYLEKQAKLAANPPKTEPKPKPQMIQNDERQERIIDAIQKDKRYAPYGGIITTPEFMHMTPEEKELVRFKYVDKHFKERPKGMSALDVAEHLEVMEQLSEVYQNYKVAQSTERENQRQGQEWDLKIDKIKENNIDNPYFTTQDAQRQMAPVSLPQNYHVKKARAQKQMTPEEEKRLRKSLAEQQEMGIGESFAKGLGEGTISTFMDEDPYDNYVPAAFWGKGKGGFKGKEFAKDLAYISGKLAVDTPILGGLLGLGYVAKAGDIGRTALAFGGHTALSTMANLEMMNQKRDLEYATKVLGDFLTGSVAGATAATIGGMTGQFGNRLFPNAGQVAKNTGWAARSAVESLVADSVDAGIRGYDLTPEERLLSITGGVPQMMLMSGVNKALNKSKDVTAKYRNMDEGHTTAEVEVHAARVKYAEEARIKFVEDVANKVAEKSMVRGKDIDNVYNLSRKKAIDNVFENPTVRELVLKNPDLEIKMIEQIDSKIKEKLPHYVTGKAEKMAFNQVANAIFKGAEGRAPQMLTKTTKKGVEKPYSEADIHLPEASNKIVTEKMVRGEIAWTKDYYKEKRAFNEYVNKIADLTEIYPDKIPSEVKPYYSKEAQRFASRIENYETSPSYMKRLANKQKELKISLDKMSKRYENMTETHENKLKVQTVVDNIDSVAERLTGTRNTSMERDIITNILTLPKKVMADMAPKINLFKWTGLEKIIKPKSITNASQIVKRKMGDQIYNLYQAGRTAENIYYRHVNVYKTYLKLKADQYTQAAKSRVGFYMLGKQEDGQAIFDNMKQREQSGVYKLTEKFRLNKTLKLPDKLPTWDDLTPQEKELAVFFHNEYKTFLEGINEARKHMGYDVIPEIDGYYPLIRALADADDRNLTFASTGDEIAAWVTRNQVKQRAGVGKNVWFSKERVGGNDAVILDPFQAMDVYAQSAFKIMDIAPYAKKMQELGEVLKGHNAGAGDFLIDTMKFFSGEFKDMTALRETLMKNANGLTVSYLGYNYNTILTQYSAHKNTIAEFGYMRTLNACAELAQHPEITNFIYEKSQYMQTRRQSSFDATINDINQGFMETKFDAMKQNSLIGMKTTDLITSEGAWWTAFKQYEKTNSVRQAIIMADDFVTKAHASASKLDLAPIQRSALGKTATAFQTFVIANWNYLVSDVMGVDPIYKHIKAFDTLAEAQNFAKGNKNLQVFEYDNKKGFAVYDKQKTTNFLNASAKMARIMMFNAVYSSAMQTFEGATGIPVSSPLPDPIDAAVEHYYNLKPGRLAFGERPAKRRNEQGHLPDALWRGGLSLIKEVPLLGGIEYGGRGIGGAQVQLAQDMADSFSRGDFMKFAWQLSALRGNPFYNLYGKISSSAKHAEQQEKRELAEKKRRGNKVQQVERKVREKTNKADDRMKSINDRVNQKLNR